jgi:Ca2+-transporting ATPase
VALGQITVETPVLHRQTAKLVRFMATTGFIVAGAYTLLYGVLRHTWLQAVLGGIALTMSMLPEEIPLVLSVFMVMGAWRISRARVLTRRAAAIETLGAATVFCTDKTGTLTLNRMAVVELHTADELGVPVPVADGAPEVGEALLRTALFASYPVPTDPMDKAIHELQSMKGLHFSGCTLLREYGVTTNQAAVVQVWEVAGEGDYLVAAKGAPETIARLCRLDATAFAEMERAIDAMAEQGTRVLAVATGKMPMGELPETAQGFPLTFVGLLGFADPLRPGVAEAVHDCQSAGIRVVMITGDYPKTAQAIARKAGLPFQKILTGNDLENLSDAELAERVRSVGIFARTRPEHKLRIVNAFKANGEIVAMTGDGVNDAPSLKAASIGVAMGGRGTDVAREAASLVLLEDDFGSVVRTIRLGRRIYDNLRKAMGYIIAVHVPIAGLSLLPIVFGLPLILTPLHIALLEMVIDPTCSLVFEAEPAERLVMERPPRNSRAPIISRSLFGWSLLQGFMAFLAVAGVFVVAVLRGVPETEVRSLAFVSLFFANLALILTNRSFGARHFAGLRRPNAMLWIVLGGTGSLLSLLFVFAPLRGVFKFGELHLVDVAICIFAGFAVLAILDAAKPLWRRYLFI